VHSTARTVRFTCLVQQREVVADDCDYSGVQAVALFHHLLAHEEHGDGSLVEAVILHFREHLVDANAHEFFGPIEPLSVVFQQQPGPLLRVQQLEHAHAHATSVVIAKAANEKADTAVHGGNKLHDGGRGCWPSSFQYDFHRTTENLFRNVGVGCRHLRAQIS
jgi:hypothetical protein